MNRIRRNGNTPVGVGGLFEPSHRPKPDHMPAVFVEAIAEFDDVRTRRAAAERTVAELTDSTSGRWAQELAAAKKADADQAAQAARAGAPVANPTAHVDALHERLKQAEAEAAALGGAQRLVESDLYQLRETEKENPTYDKAVTDARAKLATAVAQVARHAETLGRALAVREWIVDHQPYDATTDLPVPAVWPKYAAVIGGSASATDAVDLANALAAITDL